jgi:hypothetical protein
MALTQPAASETHQAEQEILAQPFDGGKIPMSRISSDVILDKLQDKLRGPALSTVPCILGPFKVHHALCDWGASMRILPYDKDITPFDTNNNPPLNVQGPITRARARQLNLEVSSFLNSSSYDYENRLLPNDYIVIRKHGEGQGILEEGLGGVEDQQGHTGQEGGPNQLTPGLFLGSRSSLH